MTRNFSTKKINLDWGDMTTKFFSNNLSNLKNKYLYMIIIIFMLKPYSSIYKLL